MLNKLLIGIALLGLFACSEDKTPPPPAAKQKAEAPTNRIPIPARVRKNLGITFAKASYRPIKEVINVPGSFELLPSAQYHYPLPLAGRITLHVKPLQKVKAGDLLMEIDAPAWRQLKAELAEAQAGIKQADAELIQAQIIQQASKGIQTSAAAGKTLNANEALIASAIAKQEAAQTRLQNLFAQAAAITGLKITELQAIKNGRSTWQSLQRIPVQAMHAATIQEVNSSTGAWQESGAEIIHAIAPQQLRFHGQALQADLNRLQDGQAVSIRPPSGHSNTYQEHINGTLYIGVSGDAEARLIDIYVDLKNPSTSSWLRPQVAGIAEINVARSNKTEVLAIPVRGVISDGLDKIIFRRNPRNPDQVIRIKADLGVSDGDWIAISSGLAEGDEIVIDGIYELKLASSSQKTLTGHFHADGTYHEGDH